GFKRVASLPPLRRSPIPWHLSVCRCWTTCITTNRRRSRRIGRRTALRRFHLSWILVLPSSTKATLILSCRQSRVRPVPNSGRSLSCRGGTTRWRVNCWDGYILVTSDGLHDAKAAALSFPGKYPC